MGKRLRSKLLTWDNLTYMVGTYMMGINYIVLREGSYVKVKGSVLQGLYRAEPALAVKLNTAADLSRKYVQQITRTIFLLRTTSSY